MKTLNARHRVLCELCPDEKIIIDVGADHGYVAEHLGAIASERMPHRRGRRPIPWVIADGLKPYAHADAAIIAGMGAHKIIQILQEAPPITTLVLHATDAPRRVRAYLAQNGWCIDVERIVPEGRAFAEVIRAKKGNEPATGLELAFGPKLLQTKGPYHLPHFTHLYDYWERIRDACEHSDPEKAAFAAERVQFLEQILPRWS